MTTSEGSPVRGVPSRVARVAAAVSGMAMRGGKHVVGRAQRAIHGHGHQVQVRPILPVADLDRASQFHESLGFDVVRWDDTYAWVQHQGDEVFHLRVVDGMRAQDNQASLFLFAPDVDAWFARLDGIELDGGRIGPLGDEPWDMREFEVVDPDGNRLRIGWHT